MIDLDSRTVMLRELAFHYGTLDVVNEDTQAFEAVYDAILAEVQEISQRPVPTPLRPRLPERVQASELARYDDAAFVENAYLRILHRDVDVDGGCNSLLKLRSGELSKDDVMFSLRMSREGEQIGGIVEGAKISRQMMKLLTRYEGCQFVENAYNWVLGREPSEAEVKQHLDLLENGLSKQELLEAFANSPERGDMRARQAAEARPALKYGDLVRYEDAEFVTNAYRYILGRRADVESAANYLAHLRAGKLTKGEVLFELRVSDEGCRKAVLILGAQPERVDVGRLLALDDQEFVNTIYMWIFGRAADEDGMNHNRKLLNQGMGKAELLSALLESPEAFGKPIVRYIKARLCADAGDDTSTVAPEAIRQAQVDIRQALQREEMLVALESMSARFTREIDALKARDASSSIQVCVAQRQAEITRQQAETALARLADVQRQLAEQKTMIERIPVGLDDADA